jgi:hypothetical protein
MDWFKKHVDMVVTIGLMASGFLWMNGKFNDLEKEILVIKTIMMMQKIIPVELAKADVE